MTDLLILYRALLLARLERTSMLDDLQRLVAITGEYEAMVEDLVKRNEALQVELGKREGVCHD